MRRAKRGITLSRFLKICHGFLRVEDIKSRVVISPPQILIVRLGIPRSIPGELTSLFRHQLQLHLIGDGSPDFTMDLENARQLPIVILRPEVDLVLHSNQLRGDANSLPVTPHTPLKHVVHT